MKVIREFAALLRWFPSEVREILRRKAERIRAETYGHQEEMRAEGMPAAYVERRTRGDLAWADLLDALAGDRGAAPTPQKRRRSP